ncbi:hypothetical protein B0H10DRAFT_2050719 [Mycena sp. CBHHK59/15]|nr:hypothetical protein B0H10DRAFT_2050681 [Mycena sp. CBHHK59/15]KAJ6612852.1 hypothetical protein B0H10DRAFT_2050719 [Mycena sp. CBHHK59/15]
MYWGILFFTFYRSFYITDVKLCLSMLYLWSSTAPKSLFYRYPLYIDYWTLRSLYGHFHSLTRNYGFEHKTLAIDPQLPSPLYGSALLTLASTPSVLVACIVVSLILTFFTF